MRVQIESLSVVYTWIAVFQSILLTQCIYDFSNGMGHYLYHVGPHAIPFTVTKFQLLSVIIVEHSILIYLPIRHCLDVLMKESHKLQNTVFTGSFYNPNIHWELGVYVSPHCYDFHYIIL